MPTGVGVQAAGESWPLELIVPGLQGAASAPVDVEAAIRNRLRDEDFDIFIVLEVNYQHGRP